MSTTFITASPEQSLRARAKAVWEAGDFGLVARYSEPAAAAFAGRLPLGPGRRVLDVACGTGNVARLAARAGCRTVGLDLATNLVEQARARAAAEGLPVDFVEGDAEALPFADASFDLVMSMFGVMFVPRAANAVAELVRVCRPGGIIALANWTPEGLMGEMLRIVHHHVPPITGAPSPLAWGDEASLRERFAGAAAGIRMARQVARWRLPFTPAQTVDFLRQFYGPLLRAFAALDRDGQARLHADLEDLFRSRNRAAQDGGNDGYHRNDGPDGHEDDDGEGATELEAEYLEAVVTRR